MANTAVIGGTGFVGNFILNTLLSSDAIASVVTLGRRTPHTTATSTTKLTPVNDANTEAWAGNLRALAPKPNAVFSALGTTRAQAGSLAAQWKIDHDLNIELATAAKEAGVETFIFISSTGTRGGISGHFPYGKMKVGVEDAVEKLEFAQSIILRPAFILGARPAEQNKNELMSRIVEGLGKVSPSLKDSLGQEAETIGRAAVHAALLAAKGKAPAKHWVLEGADIIRLGTSPEEWKDLE